MIITINNNISSINSTLEEEIESMYTTITTYPEYVIGKIIIIV